MRKLFKIFSYLGIECKEFEEGYMLRLNISLILSYYFFNEIYPFYKSVENIFLRYENKSREALDFNDYLKILF